jgi:hypothetical protein
MDRPGATDPRGLRAHQILLWQTALVGIGAIASYALGRGSPSGLALGAGLMHASLRLTAATLRLSLRPGRHPAVAGALFLAKLFLLLGVAVIGLTTRWISPMSLAIGAATLPVAIVLDTCYLAWANRRASRDDSGLPAHNPRTIKRWNIR